MKCKLLENIKINEDYYLLKFSREGIKAEFQPGQFVTVKLPQQVPGQRLGIPISIYQADTSTFTLFIKILGEGTRILAHAIQDTELDILGPLGQAFTLLTNKTVLLISGGVGYPPLRFLKDKLKDCQITWIHGGKFASDIFPCDHAYTEDGSRGEKGLVTSDLRDILNNQKFDMAYSCGPNPMLKAVASILKDYDIPLEVSLEEYMACGIGVCYGCAVQVVSNDEQPLYKRVCKDGPVFHADEIIWE
ncbi:dihydroorotate dehydrogenase electron transfer subunit [bacterium]|nr:dihydroorotate dehydrogenase electron transfer subunit [bacterium]